MGYCSSDIDSQDKVNKTNEKETIIVKAQNDSSISNELIKVQSPLTYKPNFIENLPPEILQIILSYFSSQKLHTLRLILFRNLRLVSKSMRIFTDSFFHLRIVLRIEGNIDSTDFSILSQFIESTRFLKLPDWGIRLDHKNTISATICDQLLGYLNDKDYQILDLGNCYNITNAQLKSLPESLKQLTCINCKNLGDEVLQHLPSSLERLTLNQCLGITNDGLKNLQQKNNLEFLDLGACSSIRSEGLKYLPKNLKFLALWNCTSITDAGIDSLPLHLQVLNVSHCDRLSSSSLKLLPRQLKELNLSNCTMIQDEGLQHLPATLQELSLRYCSKVSNAGIQHLSKLKSLTGLSVGHTKVTQDGVKMLTNTIVRFI